MASAGTFRRKASNSSTEKMVPVGLLGLSRKMSLVLPVIAEAMASRSCRISCSGMTVLIPPWAWTIFW